MKIMLHLFRTFSEVCFIFITILINRLKGSESVDYLGYMAPVAFIFALAAISQVNSLKKEVQQLKEELEKIKK